MTVIRCLTMKAGTTMGAGCGEELVTSALRRGRRLRSSHPGASPVRPGGPAVSVRSVADAPVALQDHLRAERPGLDEVERYVLGDRRQERGAAADDDRAAVHAQLVD